MSKIHQQTFSVTIFATAFFVCVASVSAQIVFKRNHGVTRPQQPTADSSRSLPASAVTGSITAKVVWSKDLGLPPAYPGASETYPTPCGLFVISISNNRERVRISESGTFTSDPDPDGTYTCSYTIDGLAKGQELRVTVTFIDTRMWETYPWLSVPTGGESAPPAGTYRTLAGARRVTLTDAEPTSIIDFTILYERRPIKIF